jgi:hypothetical protein
MATSLEFVGVESLVGMYQFHFSVVFCCGEEREEREREQKKPAINHKNHGQIQSSIFRSSISLTQ